MTNIRCARCGNSLTSQQEFCGSCGNSNPYFLEEIKQARTNLDSFFLPEMFHEFDKNVWYVQNRPPEIPMDPNRLRRLLKDFEKGKGKSFEMAKDELIRCRPQAAAMTLLPLAKSTKIFNDKSEDALEVLVAIGNPLVIPSLLEESYIDENLLKVLLIVGLNKSPAIGTWLGRQTQDDALGSLAIKLLVETKDPAVIDILINNASVTYIDFVEDAVSYRTETFLGGLARSVVNSAAESIEKNNNRVDALSLMFIPYNPIEVLDALKSTIAKRYCTERFRLLKTANLIEDNPTYPFRQRVLLGLPPKKESAYYFLIALMLYLGIDSPLVETELRDLAMFNRIEPGHDIGLFLIVDGIMMSRSRQIKQKYSWFPKLLINSGNQVISIGVANQALVYNYQPLADELLIQRSFLYDVPALGYCAIIHENQLALTNCQILEPKNQHRLKMWKDSFTHWISE